ncbi:dihydrolipoyl dehydrogenase family protein [Carnobacterium gallinarum]|uniref:dihydrolipoyl dehydrogenase family protein n=1 Tax=Carnobacterium gallinarum TaxID=2749 RepID=UPI0014704382|nr:NAD(P)/FAD-dependent oxidoreductase [Carnobacterium gallinarum]
MKDKMEYDVAIIGSGQAAWNAGITLSKSGKKVCMIENDLWGGTCPNRGCDPKKIFSNAAFQHYKTKKMEGVGVGKVEEMSWQKLMAFKNKLISPLSHELKSSFERTGIDTKNGFGHFKEGRLYVDETEVQAEKIILALGQKPVIPEIHGNEWIHDSYHFFEIEELPKKMLIIGGGYIAFELASIANQAGSDVTIIHRNNRPLRQFPQKIVSKLVDEMQKQGIKFVFDASVEEVEINGETLIAHTTKGIIKSDYILSAIGRSGDFEKMHLDLVGVKTDSNGVIVNEYLQTENENIYAIGDCVSKSVPKLTTTAILEGHYVGQLFLGKTEQPINYPVLSTAVFSFPRMAKVTTNSIVHSKKYVDLAESSFTFNLHYEKEVPSLLEFDNNNQLVNATILSNEADVLVNDLTILLTNQITGDKLSESILIFPTVQDSLKEILA